MFWEKGRVGGKPRLNRARENQIPWKPGFEAEPSSAWSLGVPAAHGSGKKKREMRRKTLPRGAQSSARERERVPVDSGTEERRGGAPELGRGAIEKKKKRGREAGPHVLGLRGETGLRVGGWGGAKQKGF